MEDNCKILNQMSRKMAAAILTHHTPLASLLSAVPVREGHRAQASLGPRLPLAQEGLQAGMRQRHLTAAAMGLHIHMVRFKVAPLKLQNPILQLNYSAFSVIPSGASTTARKALPATPRRHEPGFEFLQLQRGSSSLLTA